MNRRPPSLSKIFVNLVCLFRAGVLVFHCSRVAVVFFPLCRLVKPTCKVAVVVVAAVPALFPVLVVYVRYIFVPLSLADLVLAMGVSQVFVNLIHINVIRRLLSGILAHSVISIHMVFSFDVGAPSRGLTVRNCRFEAAVAVNRFVLRCLDKVTFAHWTESFITMVLSASRHMRNLLFLRIAVTLLFMWSSITTCKEIAASVALLRSQVRRVAVRVSASEALSSALFCWHGSVIVVKAVVVRVALGNTYRFVILIADSRPSFTL